MPLASTHEHDCRILETKDHRIHIKPNRTTDTRPGFFTILFLLIFSGLTARLRSRSRVSAQALTRCTRMHPNLQGLPVHLEKLIPAHGRGDH